MVVVLQNLVGEVVNHIHSADRQTVAVFAVGVSCGQELFHDTHVALHGLAPFFVDYSAFGINLGVVQCEVTSPVVEYEQA